MKTDKKEIEGKLIIDDLSENAHRVRRNLLIFSFVAIFYKLSGASIDKNGVSFYGINFEHINENFISIGISLIVLYHFFHFFLIAIAHWQYLMIRTTKKEGIIVTPGTLGRGSMDGDYGNPKDFNLYYWFYNNVNQLLKNLSSLKERIDHVVKVENLDNAKNHLDSIIRDASDIVNGRLSESLKKFDKSLKCYRAVELFRWILIVILIPLVAGIIALCLLCFYC